MKKLGIFVAVIIIISLLYFWLNMSHAKIFSGVITDTDPGCHADGLCRIKVDNFWVDCQGGWPDPDSKWGTTAGLTFYKTDIGKKVIVYARQEFSTSTFTNYFTLAGNIKYYVKVIK